MTNNLIQPVIKSVIRPVVRAIDKAIKRMIEIVQSAYRFDGFDDYGVLAYRAINPDGDIDIEWEQNTQLKADGNVIIAQCGTGVNSTQECRLTERTDGVLELIVGGSSIVALTAAQGYTRTGKYRLTLQGTNLSVFKSGVLLYSTVFTRGTAREPSAPTYIGCRPVSGGFVNYARGTLYNVRINGVLYPIGDRNQSIQLPSPNNLGAELITQTVLENPHSKGTQWTYLGNGRWQLVGDGSLNELIFQSYSSQPAQGFLEFEIESITGSLGCTVNNLTRGTFNTVGVKRFFYTDKNETGGNGAAIVFKRVGGATSCVIKNISFKPLVTLNPTEFVTNGDFSAGTSGWTTTGTLSVSNGQATLTTQAAQNSRTDNYVTLQAGAYYEVSCDLIGLSGVTSVTLNLRRGVAGSFLTINEVSRNSAGKLSFIVLAPATDALVQVRGDAINAGTITFDNVSIRKLDSICNPLTLVNTESAWWSTIGAPSRDVYVFDGVDDHATLSYRAINPDGDNSFEFWSPNVSALAQTIISQNVSDTASAREFHLVVGGSSNISVIWGGTETNILTPAQGYEPNKKYWLNFVGNNFTIAKDAPTNIIRSASFTRGAARESVAVTRIGGRSSGSGVNVLFAGRQYDIKINGTLWPMQDRNQTIQLPSPSGLGAELITPSILENPAVKGTQWTYLGAGRWQYVGDGSFNEMKFITPTNQPNAGYLEFEVESISGNMTCAESAAGNDSSPLFNSVGVKRYFFTKKGNTGDTSFGNCVTFKRSGGAASCIIKNISFKPLSVVSSTELVSNGDFSAGTSGWIANGGGSISVTSGQATLTTVAGQASRFERVLTLEAGNYYQMSMNVISLSGVSLARLQVIRGAAGGYVGVHNATTSSGNTVINTVFMATASDALVQVVGDSTNSGTVVVDNVSIRKLDSLCNPMTLVNTTSDRWREIDV